MGGTLTAQSRSFDNAFNPETSGTERRVLSGFGLLDLRASYVFNANWTARAKIANVLDKNYPGPFFVVDTPFNQPGRAYYLSLHYQQ